MYKKNNIRKWKNFFQDKGISDDIINSYLKYIKILNQNNVPVIFEFAHLSKLFGLKEQIIASMINSTDSYYRSFHIPKRKGGKRHISAPYPSLLHCQRWIYENILLSQEVHNCAHGFTPGKSIITNASKHLSNKCLLKMDMKDFFPSIKINWVINLFNKLGYANNVSYYLSSLCCHEGVLSQGAATSPYLTNILLLNLDNRLFKLSLSYNLNYSRYADDITFSGNYIPHKFIITVTEIIEDYGLEVNTKKTTLHTKPGQRIVTGLSVAGDELKLPRKTKRVIRKDLFYIEECGYLSHITKKKIKNPFYLDSLKGKLLFWKQIEPNNQFVPKGLGIIQKVIGKNQL